MTRRIVERTFDPKQPLLVRRAFSAAGRTFQPGDDFDWRRLSVAHRRVSQMFDAGYLVHRDEVAFAQIVGTPDTIVDTQTKVSPPDTPIDNSDLDVDSLLALQAIAQNEGVSLRSSKNAQRVAIIEARAARVS